MKFKNYRNKYTDDDRIYSTEDVYKMSLGEVFKRKSELLSQNRQIGMPTPDELRSSGNVIWINAYKRDDGIEVCGHWRSKPDSIEENNLGNGKLERQEYWDKNGRNFYADENRKETKDNTILGDEVQGFVYQQFAKPFYPVSAELLRNAMQNLEPAKKNSNAVIIDKVDSLSPELQSALNIIGVPSSSKGVYYNERSLISKLFSESPQIKGLVKDKNILKKIKDCLISSEELSFEFGGKNPINFKEFDRYNSLQHAKIVNPKIEKGYLIADLIDYYDFSKRDDNLKNLPNNWGYKQQERGKLKNYFICTKIKVKI